MIKIIYYLIIIFNISLYSMTYLANKFNEITDKYKKVATHAAGQAIINLGQKINDTDKKITIKKTTNEELNKILENYETEYYQINTTKDQDGKLSEDNTKKIIEELQKNSTNNAIKNEYIKTIYQDINTIKEKNKDHYYYKLMHHIMTENKNKTIELTPEECKKIISINNIFKKINEESIFNIFFPSDKSDQSINKYLGDENITLSSLTESYNNNYNEAKKKIEETLKNQDLNIKSILKVCITSFKNSATNIEKRLKENHEEIRNLTQNKNKLEGIAIGFRNELKKLHEEAQSNLKKTKETFFFNIPKMKNLQKRSEILMKKMDTLKIKMQAANKENRYTPEDREKIEKYELLQTEIDTNKEAINHDVKIKNITNLIILLEKLLENLDEKKKIYSSTILDIITDIKKNIENLKESNKMMAGVNGTKKIEINEILSICNILTLIKNSNKKEELIENNTKSNDILFTLFLSNLTIKEKLNKIIPLLQYIPIKINWEMDQKNIFFKSLTNIKSSFSQMEEPITNIRKLLLKVNSYISFVILLNEINPQTNIEKTLSQKLKDESPTIFLSETTSSNSNNHPGNKIGQFGQFILMKSKIFLQTIASILKYPFIRKE